MKHTYTPEFLKIAKDFSNNYKRFDSFASGRIFKHGGHSIIYKDRLISNGKVLQTVARVGNDSGRIELDKTLLEEYNSKHFCYFLILWCGAMFKLLDHQSADTVAMKQYLKEKRPVKELLIHIIALFSGNLSSANLNIKRTKNIFKLCKLPLK